MAQSGHCHRAERCPLLGVKRTSDWQASMSASDPSGHEQVRIAAAPPFLQSLIPAVIAALQAITERGLEPWGEEGDATARFHHVTRECVSVAVVGKSATASDAGGRMAQ
jgi:hypothetical protein